MSPRLDLSQYSYVEYNVSVRLCMVGIVPFM